MKAEKKGFEPLIPFRVYTLSRRASSTTPALLRGGAKIAFFSENSVLRNGVYPMPGWS